MVDTGASVVALRERDAGRLGIFPTPRDYTGRSSTANGIVRVAPVRSRWAVVITVLWWRFSSTMSLPSFAVGDFRDGFSASSALLIVPNGLFSVTFGSPFGTFPVSRKHRLGRRDHVVAQLRR